ncbi:hypothetical protein T07_7397 [Trichinella nelsoni]|uniref:Uncharacterized protein n=1 Tax=Trichinella nelsoni TaxID=6336 RepID=A0A0V0RVA9_9BILA|nr:hypothetical protein T07_7397 [Trichinella nelsoni]
MRRGIRQGAQQLSYSLQGRQKRWPLFRREPHYPAGCKGLSGYMQCLCLVGIDRTRR